MAGFLKGKKLPLGDGVNSGDVPNLGSFPYESHPAEGFANSKGLRSHKPSSRGRPHASPPSLS